MRAEIERWQGALAHAWVGIWAASATNAWRAPRQADATLPSAQFRRIPLGHRVFFAPAVVASLARCARIALRAAPHRRLKNHRCRDPHEFFNSLLESYPLSKLWAV